MVRRRSTRGYPLRGRQAKRLLSRYIVMGRNKKRSNCMTSKLKRKCIVCSKPKAFTRRIPRFFFKIDASVRQNVNSCMSSVYNLPMEACSRSTAFCLLLHLSLSVSRGQGKRRHARGQHLVCT